jgi:hypothetical protein
MDEKLFAELVESVKEGGAIMRGEMEPSREWYFESSQTDDDQKSAGRSEKQSGEEKNGAL